MFFREVQFWQILTICCFVFCVYTFRFLFSRNIRHRTEQTQKTKVKPFLTANLHKIFVTQLKVSLSLSYVYVPLYSIHDFDAS